MGQQIEELARFVGTEWHIARNYFRLYACCNPIHPALDAVSAALAEPRPAASEIDRIDIQTYSFEFVMYNPDPPNYFASKYSLPHAAAAMVVTGRPDHSALNDAALQDPLITALRRRVHITEGPAMQATRAVNSRRDDFNQPYTQGELRANWRARCCQPTGPWRSKPRSTGASTGIA